MTTQNIELSIPDDARNEFTEYLYERENSQATIQKYQRDVKTFLHYLDGKSITKRRLMEYKEWLTMNYAARSTNSMIVALNQFLEFLGGGRMKVKRLKIQRQLFLTEDKCLTKQEYKRLVTTAQSQKNGKLALIMETICCTGIRISELQFFTVERVHKGRIVVCNKGKNRTVLIPKALRLKLLCFIEKQKIYSGSIFVTRTGKPLDRSNIWAQMKALHTDAKIDGAKIFPHNLRHLFARVYYKMTKDLSGLADLLGHSSVEVTRIYTADTGKAFQRMIDRMELLI